MNKDALGDNKSLSKYFFYFFPYRHKVFDWSIDSKQHHKNMTWHLSQKTVCLLSTRDVFTLNWKYFLWCEHTKYSTALKTLLRSRARCWFGKESTLCGLEFFISFLFRDFFSLLVFCAQICGEKQIHIYYSRIFKNGFGYRSLFRAEVGQLLTHKPKWLLKCRAGANGRCVLGSFYVLVPLQIYCETEMAANPSIDLCNGAFVVFLNLQAVVIMRVIIFFLCLQRHL